MYCTTFIFKLPGHVICTGWEVCRMVGQMYSWSLSLLNIYRLLDIIITYKENLYTLYNVQSVPVKLAMGNQRFLFLTCS